MVSPPDVIMEGNIIFDHEGVQRSFITNEMALNLKSCGKDNISLASFGSKSTTNKTLHTGVITACYKTRNGNGMKQNEKKCGSSYVSLYN